MNKFYPWMESNLGSNCQSSDTFGSDTQRVNGFQGGQAASSLRVNTVLRQSTLVICALMNIAAPNDTNFDVQSSTALDYVQGLLNTYFNTFVKGTDLTTTLANYVKADRYATSSVLGLLKVNGTFSDPQYPVKLDNNRYGYVEVTKKVYRHEISLTFNGLTTATPTGYTVSQETMRITLTLRGVSAAINNINTLNDYLNSNAANNLLISKYIEPVQVSLIPSGSANAIKALAFNLRQESGSTSYRVELFGLDGSLYDTTKMRSVVLNSSNVSISDSVAEITI